MFLGVSVLIALVISFAIAVGFINQELFERGFLYIFIISSHIFSQASCIKSIAFTHRLSVLTAIFQVLVLI